MPARAQIISVLLRVFSFLLLACFARAYEAPTAPAPRPLLYPPDTYAFKNETVWNYSGGTLQTGPDTAKKQRQYTRRCFVLCRSTLQFWKFAAFDPSLRPLGDDAMSRRIRDVCARSVWLPILPPAERIVIPGYHNLREASAARPDLFRANIGNGWSIYFRPGNFPITLPVDRSTEARVHDEIDHDLQMNYPTIIWAYRFPSLKLNHVLLIFHVTRDANIFHYRVYDPNYSDRFGRLDYDLRTRNFSYQPTYYFKGGYVNVRAIYRGVFQ